MHQNDQEADSQLPLCRRATFRRNERGGVALIVAFLIIPLLLAMGMAVDYIRAYNIKWKLRADLDAALIASVKKIDSLTEAQIEANIQQWFVQNSSITGYTIGSGDIIVNFANYTITATVSDSVATTFMSLANINSITVSATSTVQGAATSYLNVYLVLDKSASMMLGATTSDQTKMINATGCAFACHDESVTVSGKTYSSYYAWAAANNVTLRADVLQDAAAAVLDDVDNIDPDHARIKVGLYRLSTTTYQVLAPTTSTSTARAKLTATETTTDTGLGDDSSTDGTYFQTALSKLATYVGTQGDGKSASSPLKLVMLITDGVNSQRSWVTTVSGTRSCSSFTYGGTTKSGVNCKTYPYAPLVAPLNPAWCSSIKSGATMTVLYTTYLPMVWDWGWVTTLAQKMSTSAWYTSASGTYAYSTWGATVNTSAGYTSSTLKIDYLAQALSDCASTSDNFLQATDVDQIETGLSDLFEKYVASVRITQ